MAEDKDSKSEDKDLKAAQTGKATTGTAAKIPPVVSDSVGKPVAAKKQSRGPVWLALLIALGGLGAAGYTYWQLEQYKGAVLVDARNSEQRLLENTTAQVVSVQSALADYRRELDQQQQSIDELLARVASTRRQIGEITHVSRRSWMLAEAEYLLRLANQRLVMERETRSPLALLQAADNILLEVDDINLHQVRGAIANEIAALKAMGRLDVEGAFLQLAALAGQLSALEILSPQEVVAQGEPALGERDGLSSALDRLEQLVTVRHRDQPVAPLLPPEQHYYVQQNLRLMLEQAQLALLQRKPALYAQSLTNAEQWVRDYFQLNRSSSALTESIAELGALTISPEIPDISGSLALLKAYLTDPDASLAAASSEEAQE